MRYVIACLIVLLLILHQDFWNWDNARLWFGFLPQALAWHVALSLAAALVWWMAVHYCWPKIKQP